MSVRETVARNTLFNVLGRGFEAVISVVLIAYIVAKIGTGQYGLWAIVGALTGYATLFDAGLGSAYGRFIAEHRALGDNASIDSVVSTGLAFYFVFAVVFLGVTWPLAGALFGVLEGATGLGDFADATTREDLQFLVTWALALFAVSNLLAPFTAIQTGFQRMDVTNAISAFTAIVKLIATVGFLEAGYGVRGLIYANGAVLAVFAGLTIASAFRLHPNLRVGPRHAALSTFRSLFSFGWRTQVARLSNLIMFETDVLVIAVLLRDLQLAGLYRIGIELANKLRQLPAALLTALLPAASDLHARAETARLRDIYIATTKYTAVVAVPGAYLLAGMAGPVLAAWQGSGEELGVAAGVLRIMAIGYLANMLPGAGVAIALGMGRADLQMRAGLISMVSNILLTIFLALTIGFWGIPIATVASMALSWAWFAISMRGAVGAGVQELFAASVRGPLLAGLPALVIAVGADLIAVQDSGRIWNLAIVVLGGGVSVLAYLAALRILPVFSASDMRFFDETLRLGRLPGYRAWSRTLRTP